MQSRIKTLQVYHTDFGVKKFVDTLYPLNHYRRSTKSIKLEERETRGTKSQLVFFCICLFQRVPCFFLVQSNSDLKENHFNFRLLSTPGKTCTNSPFEQSGAWQF